MLTLKELEKKLEKLKLERTKFFHLSIRAKGKAYKIIFQNLIDRTEKEIKELGKELIDRQITAYSDSQQALYGTG